MTSYCQPDFAGIRDPRPLIPYRRRLFFGNRSPAPHLCPFRPSQVQGVHLGGRNEQIRGTYERLRLRVEGNLLPLVNGYIF